MSYFADISDEQNTRDFLHQEIMGIPVLYLIVGAGVIALFMTGLVAALIVLRRKMQKGKDVVLEYQGMSNISASVLKRSNSAWSLEE